MKTESIPSHSRQDPSLRGILILRKNAGTGETDEPFAVTDGGRTQAGRRSHPSSLQKTVPRPFHRFVSLILTAFLLISACAYAVPVSAAGSRTYLYPGGVPFGVRFYADGVLVVGFSDGADCKNAASRSGIKVGDILTELDGKPISGADAFADAIASGEGKPITLTVKRCEETVKIRLTPTQDKNGKYRTGLWVRDSGAGIGTVTYIDPDTLRFGGLGHGICDGDNKSPIPIRGGSIHSVTVGSVVKGTSGTPGEIKGYFGTDRTGTLLSNREQGVFGYFDSLPPSLPESPLPVATRDEVHEGGAYIWCTLSDGAPCKYSIAISDIARESAGNKCFTVTVTDPALIAKSGGIVQGMSGSPIIQDGLFVGAVTHVLINDPTVGYGIFLCNMLEAS